MARRISAVLAVAWSGWAAGASACEGGGVAAFLPCPPPLRRAWTARRPLASPLRADADGTHYEAIGVSQRASEGEIRSAYLKLAKRLHPDVSTDPADVARFQRIAEAYQVLSDGKLRAVYDQVVTHAHVQTSTHTPIAVEREKGTTGICTTRTRQSLLHMPQTHATLSPCLCQPEQTLEGVQNKPGLPHSGLGLLGRHHPMQRDPVMPPSDGSPAIGLPHAGSQVQVNGPARTCEFSEAKKERRS